MTYPANATQAERHGQPQDEPQRVVEDEPDAEQVDEAYEPLFGTKDFWEQEWRFK